MKKIIVVLFGMLFMTGCGTTVSLDDHWHESVTPYSDNLICTLKITSVMTFDKDHLSAESKNEEPLRLTFVDLDTNSPAMIGNLGDRTPLIKRGNSSRIYLIEETGVGNLNIFTLFRDKNILLMSKQYSLVEPFGLLMMGDCLAGI